MGSGTDAKDIFALKSIYQRFKAKWKQNGADGLTSLQGDVERAKLARARHSSKPSSAASTARRASCSTASRSECRVRHWWCEVRRVVIY